MCVELRGGFLGFGGLVLSRVFTCFGAHLLGSVNV